MSSNDTSTRGAELEAGRNPESTSGGLPQDRQQKGYRGWIAGLLENPSRKSLVTSISAMISGGVLAVGMRFLGGLVQAHLVAPELLGAYSKYTILSGYLLLLQAGVYTAMALQFPYFMGRGENAEAIARVRNALGWTYLLAGIHLIIYLSLIAVALAQGDTLSVLGWASQLCATLVAMYVQYLAGTFRNNSEFVTWSKVSVLGSAMSILFLPVVAAFGFIGLCARSAVPDSISTAYAHWKRPFKVRPSFDLHLIRKMIVFGGPLLVFGYLSTTLLEALTRTIIFQQLGEKSLGLLAFATALSAGLTTVATCISQVFHPRIAQRCGDPKNTKMSCFNYCVKASGVGVGLMLPIVLLACWASEPLIRVFLPKYLEAVPSLRWLCWISLVPVMDLPRLLLEVGNRTKDLMISAMLMYGFLGGAAVLACSHLLPITLLAVVKASVLCRFIYAVSNNSLAWRFAARNSAPARA